MVPVGLRTAVAAALLSWVAAGPLPAETPATTLTIVLEVPDSGGHESSSPGIVRIESSSLDAPLQAEVALPGSATFTLPARASVRVWVEAAGLWAPGEALWLGSEPEAITIHLLQTGVLEATLMTPAAVPPPEKVEVRFQAAPGAEASFAGQHSRPCLVRERKVRCEVPAGLLDFRLGARGFVSVHFWGQEVPRGGRRSLGDLRFRPGASVIGWVAADAEGFDPEQASVTLTPLSAGMPRSPGSSERHASLALNAGANARGFFELASVAPGSYGIRVEHPGFAPARLSPVVVREGVEVELPRIDLALPLSLTVRIRPTRDPFHSSWLVDLGREGALPGVIEAAAGGPVEEGGVFRAPRLEPGLYRLTVSDSRGSRWHAEAVELSSDTHHEVVLPYERLEGLLTLAGEPLTGANVFFGGRSGDQKVVVRSNEEGRFYVFLPRRDAWFADVEKEAMHLWARVEGIHVEKDPDEPWAKVEIEVPDTRIFGEVVDETGRPLAAALVDVQGPGESKSQRVFTSENGEFEVRGFEAGRWRLEARQHPGPHEALLWAPLVDVQVEEGLATGPVRLVARSGGRVSGWVVAPNGNGVPGTIVVFGLEHSEGAVSLEIPYQVTDADGSFEAQVPAQVSAIVLQVFPPGFAARQLRVQLPQEGPVMVPVDPSGGTLVLLAGTGGHPLPQDFSQRTAVFGEYLYYAPFLRLWSGVHGLHESRDRLIVPNMEPGIYTACWDGVGEALPSGRLPFDNEGPCVSGTLVPSGELALGVPVPSEER